MRLVGPEVHPRYQTLGEMLATLAKADRGIHYIHPGQPEVWVSHADLRVRARRIAASLRQVGIHPGDRVAVILPTCPEFVEVFFGAILAGAVPVPLYPPVRLGRLDEYHRATSQMMRSVGARLLLTDANCGRLLGRSVELVRPELGVLEVSDLYRGTDELEVDSDPDWHAFIQFSSGSTGAQKPIGLSHRNLVCQAQAQTDSLTPLGAAHVVVSWVPLYHDLGLVGAVLGSLNLGSSLVLISPDQFLARPAIWLQALSHFRGTVCPTPPFGLSLATRRVRDEDLKGLDLSSVDSLLIGAEPVSLQVLEAFADRFAPYGLRREALRPVFGLAEASLGVTFSPNRSKPKVRRCDPAALCGGRLAPGSRPILSCGVAVPGISVEVRDEQRVPLEAGQVGQIWIQGQSVIAEYVGNPQASREAVFDGWLNTGDLGFFEDGELYVSGRAKDVICVRGANHTPHEFEDCVQNVEGVRLGCVAAVGTLFPDSEGEELLLFVELATTASSDLERRVREEVLRSTGIRPHTVLLLERGTIPRTSSGKLRRREALRRYLAGELHPPLAVNRWRLALELFTSVMAYTRARLALGR